MLLKYFREPIIKNLNALEIFKGPYIKDVRERGEGGVCEKRDKTGHEA